MKKIGTYGADNMDKRRNDKFLKEKTIERKLTEAVKSVGGLAPKFVSPGMVGVPDRR